MANLFGQQDILLGRRDIPLGQEDILLGQEDIRLGQDTLLGQQDILAKNIFCLANKTFFWAKKTVFLAERRLCIVMFSLKRCLKRLEAEADHFYFLFCFRCKQKRNGKHRLGRALADNDWSGPVGSGFGCVCMVQTSIFILLNEEYYAGPAKSNLYIFLLNSCYF